MLNKYKFLSYQMPCLHLWKEILIFRSTSAFLSSALQKIAFLKVAKLWSCKIPKILVVLQSLILPLKV